MEIKASCLYDLKTITALTRASLSKGKTNPIVFLVLWCVVTVLYIVASFLVQEPLYAIIATRILTIFIAATTLRVLYYYFLLPKKQYKAMANTQNTQNTFVFEEDKFSVSSSNKSLDEKGVFNYDVLLKVKETKEYLILYIRKNTAFVVDKSTFENGTSEDLQKTLKPMLGKKYIICNY